MTELDLESKEWNAVRVGPETVGWAGPYRKDEHTMQIAVITVMMGDRDLPFSTKMVLDSFWSSDMNKLPPDTYEEVAFVQNLLGYGRCFAVRVPDNSLDVEDGQILYTERSMEVLYIVLYKLFTAFVAEVQSDLNTRNPIEVVRKFAELYHYDFPEPVYENLTWRGRKLNDLTHGTTLQAKAVTTGPSARFPYLKLPGELRFDAFVEWQTRAGFNFDRIFPENVFLIKGSSPEEYKLIEQWFDMPDVLEKHLARIRPTEKCADATFLLCRTGDALEDWVDGEVLSVQEFSRAMAKVGAPRRKARKQNNRR